MLTSKNIYCYCLHFLNRIQAKNIKAGRQYVCSSITQQQTIIIYLRNKTKLIIYWQFKKFIYLDLFYLDSFPGRVLFNTITILIKLWNNKH